METKLDQLITIVSKMSEDMIRMSEDIKDIKAVQIEHSKDIKDIKATQAEHSQQLTAIQSVTMENQRFINALSQDVARTATKDSIASLDSKFDLLNNRLFQTENKVNLLSVAK